MNFLTASIVVPVYGNSDSLEILYQEMCLEISKYSEVEFELIFVDDGSRDNSWEIINQLLRVDPKRVRAVKLSRNFGQIAAMKAGYTVATGSIIISISADLQDPTSLIGQMIDEHLRGAEIVLCNRLKRSDSLLSRLTSGFAYSMLRKRVPEIPPGGFDVFLFSSRVKESLLDLPGRFSFLQGDLLNLGFKVSTVGFHRSNRPFGKSGYTFSKKLQTFFDAIIDTSYGLIQYVVRIGFLISVFGIALAGYVILGKFLHRDPFSGFALIASSVLIIGGIQIALIGLVGEYVWRIYDISRRRPNFIIEENLP